MAAALGAPGHAYLFRGPRGSGKAAAARAFAAELLAEGASDPDDARRRALLDPSPHPDLVWLRPPGAQHLVEDVREQVIRAASLSPAEGTRRVFVIEEAEDLRDESQNALLKTLEEPAPFAHLILICSEPEQLAETILSRCAPIEFGPLAPDAVLEALGEGADADAAARLSGGDVELARLLADERGAALRAIAEEAARAPRSGSGAPEPWRGLLAAASEAGERAGAEEESRLLEEAEVTARRGRKGKLSGRRSTRCGAPSGGPAPRHSTSASASAAPGTATWRRSPQAQTMSFSNTDRLEQLAEDADGLDPANARAAVEWVLDTRRRLRVNVSEELALEALWLRLSAALAPEV